MANIAKLVGNVVGETIPLRGGEVAHINFLPNVYSPEDSEVEQTALEMAKYICKGVESWDLEWEENDPVEVVPEQVAKLPDSLLLVIMEKIDKLKSSLATTKK